MNYSNYIKQKEMESKSCGVVQGSNYKFDHKRLTDKNKSEISEAYLAADNPGYYIDFIIMYAGKKGW